MDNQQSIACPDCKSPILFDAQSLLQGMTFQCSNCGASIGLNIESKSIVEETLDRFDKLKSDIHKDAKL